MLFSCDLKHKSKGKERQASVAFEKSIPVWIDISKKLSWKALSLDSTQKTTKNLK
jgi:hypothetical protein